MKPKNSFQHFGNSKMMKAVNNMNEIHNEFCGLFECLGNNELPNNTCSSQLGRMIIWRLKQSSKSLKRRSCAENEIRKMIEVSLEWIPKN